jgi:hypothetical protein
VGLDITVHTKVVPVDEAEVPHTKEGDLDWDAMYEQDIRKAFVYKGFEDSYRGLPGDDPVEGSYVRSVGDTWGFRAGSYSGYGNFRSLLCYGMHGITISEFWEKSEAYKDKPFYELLNFADNEGTIGSEAAADLAVDFVENREQLVPHLEDWMERYDEWTRACQDASDGGMIDFH